MTQAGGRIIDCFAPRPLTGCPVAVFGEALGGDPDTLAAVATAVAMPAVAVDASDPPAAATSAPPGHIDDPPTAVMAAAASVARGGDPPDAISMGGQSHAVTTDVEGRLWVGVDAPTVTQVDPSVETITAALGLQEEQVAPVVERAPVAVAAGATTQLIIPVTYLSALAALAVDTLALRTLCAAHGADAVFCYSFDTLTRQAAVHGRPMPLEQAHPAASATGAVGCITALRAVGALGGTTDPVIVEQADHWGRPTRMAVDTSDGPRIGGQVQHTGELTLQAAAPGDIIVE
jgi:Predicted epimerase, PhzC/PhzF homolog